VRVDEDLLVLLEPSIHGVPIEADQVAQVAEARSRDERGRTGLKFV
jgi:hypothetical protein